jgi:hypothetical protein
VAEIIAKVQTRPLGSGPESGAAPASQAAKPEFTPANLLADARTYAAGDQTMLTWAEKVEKSLGSKTRGAAMGPQEGVAVAAAGGTVTYKLPFRAGQPAYIYVSGDGSSGLDLYVLDENGNAIAYDERYADECEVAWTPRWTGAFTIVVKNQGRKANRFYLMTN